MKPVFSEPIGTAEGGQPHSTHVIAASMSLASGQSMVPVAASTLSHCSSTFSHAFKQRTGQTVTSWMRDADQ